MRNVVDPRFPAGELIKGLLSKSNDLAWLVEKTAEPIPESTARQERIDDTRAYFEEKDAQDERRHREMLRVNRLNAEKIAGWRSESQRQALDNQERIERLETKAAEQSRQSSKTRSPLVIIAVGVVGGFVAVKLINYFLGLKAGVSSSSVIDTTFAEPLQLNPAQPSMDAIEEMVDSKLSNSAREVHHHTHHNNTIVKNVPVPGPRGVRGPRGVGTKGTKGDKGEPGKGVKTKAKFTQALPGRSWN